MSYLVFLLMIGVACFVAGWRLRGWGLDGSTRMSDGYERERREALLRELNAARIERDDVRTQLLEMHAANAGVSTPTSSLRHATERAGEAQNLVSPLLTPLPDPLPEPLSVLGSSRAVPTTKPGAARAADPVDAADDLTRIKGVGPKLAQTLVASGITRFAQIAAWSATDVEQINAKLRFSGRIERDGWVTQARALHRKD